MASNTTNPQIPKNLKSYISKEIGSEKQQRTDAENMKAIMIQVKQKSVFFCTNNAFCFHFTN